MEDQKMDNLLNLALDSQRMKGSGRETLTEAARERRESGTWW